MRQTSWWYDFTLILLLR